jgi:glycosyltransferase involved in cell wall biosynthesis
MPDIAYGGLCSLRGRSIVRLACTLATGLHVTTPFMAALAATHGYRTVTIPIGIDLAARRHYERPDGPPWRLLKVASLNPIKDHSTLLRALAIARRTVDMRLDLVGEDTLNGRLQRDAAVLGLDDAVAFHGFVRNDDLVSFHRAAHVYVQSSRHEAAGIAVLEAAASGLPIVGTRVGFVHDWAPEAALGVPPNDPEALAAAIVELLSDPAERRRLAVAAYARATTYDVDRTAGELTRLYESVAQASASGASDNEQTQR